MNKESLLKLIADAFAEVQLGEGVGLFEGQALDDYADPKPARERDEKQDWSAISDTDLQRCQSSLSFFDAVGFRFHLPAFMCLDLRAKYPGGDQLLFHLGTAPNAAEAFDLMNEQQKSVARAYLEFLRSVHEQPPETEASPATSLVDSAIALLDKAIEDSDS